MNRMTHRFQSGQSLMELVIGIGLVVVVTGAIAITTIQSLQNTQFSKNQVEATKKAQENIEKVRTIKNANYGVCTQTQVAALPPIVCSTWDDIWTTTFGSEPSCSNGCTFVIQESCNVSSGGATQAKPICLTYSATRATLPNGFTSQITIEDEAPSQKKVTSRVYWTDTTGEHSSDLVTIMSRLN